MPDPIDWPVLYAFAGPELHEAGKEYRAAFGTMAAVAIEWANAPAGAQRDEAQRVAFAAALKLRDAEAWHQALGARLWAERRGGGSDA